MPWPMTHSSESHGGNECQDDDYESWTLNEENFQWLIDANGQWCTDDGQVTSCLM